MAIGIALGAGGFYLTNTPVAERAPTPAGPADAVSDTADETATDGEPQLTLTPDEAKRREIISEIEWTDRYVRILGGDHTDLQRWKLLREMAAKIAVEHRAKILRVSPGWEGAAAVTCLILPAVKERVHYQHGRIEWDREFGGERVTLRIPGPDTAAIESWGRWDLLRWYVVPDVAETPRDLSEKRSGGPSLYGLGVPLKPDSVRKVVRTKNPGPPWPAFESADLDLATFLKEHRRLVDARDYKAAWAQIERVSGRALRVRAVALGEDLSRRHQFELQEAVWPYLSFTVTAGRVAVIDDPQLLEVIDVGDTVVLAGFVQTDSEAAFLNPGGLHSITIKWRIWCPAD